MRVKSYDVCRSASVVSDLSDMRLIYHILYEYLFEGFMDYVICIDAQPRHRIIFWVPLMRMKNGNLIL